MVSSLQSGGTIVNYSSRFTLSGMIGTFAPAIFAGMQDVGANINGPSRQSFLGQNLNNQHPFDPWNIPLGQQTGSIVYAPMQSYPPTKITKSLPTPQYPSSPYTIVTTMMPPNPSISKTMTQAITWSFQQMENPVCSQYLCSNIAHSIAE
jgi:Yeast cell wall synthesis protein KRE9/KNH1